MLVAPSTTGRTTVSPSARGSPATRSTSRARRGSGAFPARSLAAVWCFSDWRDFRGNPPTPVRVLVLGDERDGEWAPAGVVSRPGAGRVFHTALGHDVDAYQGPEFLAHLRGGLLGRPCAE
ncbi:ThuA domain-containing protein [Streptomyces sp. IBSBF 2806]|uniref:ThuA domain-containing protein n=1 Tax=Streptomyces sp. IBSBF 2806 TaxID=2903529 RepID=UPI003FA6E763